MNWKYFFIVLGVFLFGACGPYQEVLKKGTSGERYALAQSLYDEGKYAKAERLLESQVSIYLGKPGGEALVMLYGKTLFARKRYGLAAYQFERFAKSWPKSEFTQEALFLEGKSYFLDSPKYSLEQTDTYKAIDKLQSLIDRYPDTPYLNEVNNIVLELLTRLQQKKFEIAKGYNKISDYQAAIKALDNFMLDNPGSVFKEEAMYLKLHSMGELAKNSVRSKEKQRLQEALQMYDIFSKSYPESYFKEKAAKINKEVSKKINELDENYE